MKTSIVLYLVTLFASCLAFGQNQDSQQQAGPIRKVIPVQHVSPAEIRDALSGWGGIRSSHELGVVVITAADEQQARDLESAITQLDTPARSDRAANVELTIHYLGASESGPTSDIQGPLASVVSELKKNFAYKSYRLLETAILNTRQGHRTSLEGIIPGEAETAAYLSYGIDVSLRGVNRRATPSVIELDKLRTFVRLPIPKDESGGFVFHNMVLDTAIDVPEGKMVVVGKAGARGPASSIFVVLQARVVG